jgi:uncharacterized protein YbjT (DUF2867 family)
MENQMKKPLADLHNASANSAALSRKVLVAGASGLVGGMILSRLLEDSTVTEVHALVRRELTIRHSKLRTHQVDFKAIPSLPPLDEVYLALGTTISQAGSRAAFRVVDFDANLAVARAALAAGARRIGLVSAYGANAQSMLFYARVKGELEDALTALSAETLVIVRPSLLLGDRDSLHQATRRAEKIGICASAILGPILPRNYRPVEARKVANTLLGMVPVTQGKLVLQPENIQNFAARPF